MLGDELRKARDAAGFSQDKLAFDAGLDRAYISSLENNKKSPTVEPLFEICRALKVPASEILARGERDLSARPRKSRYSRASLRRSCCRPFFVGPFLWAGEPA